MKNTKQVVCFKPEQGQFNAGATSHQHSEFGPICVLHVGDGSDAKAGDMMLRLPAEKAIELGNLLMVKGQAALCGGGDE